ncbi:ROK family protein [Salinispira pacifica]|uniref:ROK family protein n=1 Tax=Salinispira pacifica TaxID=1307761 RepID=UPI0004143291|nr:ROK family protein [Salinispira pacifica]
MFEAGACEPGPSAAGSSAAEPSSAPPAAAGEGEGACPPLLGVGVAMSGIVDQQRGLLKRSRLLGAEEDAALEERFARLFGVPVMLENDANAAIGGELFASRYRELGDALFMLIESELFRDAPAERPRLSLGLGLALDSRVHQGVDHTSGEFRSVYWQEGSDTQFSIPSSRLLDLSTNRDTRSRLFLEMGRNIALLINSLNIHTVIVGGDIQGFQDELAECLHRAVAENWSYSGTPAFQIREARQGEYASAYGAACLHANRLYAVDSFDEFTLRGLKTGLDAFEHAGAKTTTSMQ